MVSIRQYCEMMSTEQLQSLLREEYHGQGSLPTSAILEIRDILSQRDPSKPDAAQLIRQLCEQYL